jgi:hypothetical protein
MRALLMGKAGTAFISPPYCPNPRCFWHSRENIAGAKFWLKEGFAVRKNGSSEQRFRCNYCFRKFSNSIFTLDYRNQRRGYLNAQIFHGVVHGRSNRSLSRRLACSESLIRRRLLRIFRCGLLKHSSILSNLKLFEPIAYDGLENFAGTQYDPNHLNQAIGAESLFVYDFNYCPLNRKGRMSPRQKLKLLKIVGDQGRYDPKAVRDSTGTLLERLARLAQKSKCKLTLFTDEHFQYDRAINWDLPKDLRSWIEHKTVSSKATRNFQNILFSVNHMDLLIRDRSSAFKRETIAFSKKASRMVQRYALFMFYKNYMRPRFVRPHKRDPRAHTHSPAMYLGLSSKLLKFYEFFNPREIFKRAEDLGTEWRLYFEDVVPYARSLKYS